MTPNDEILEYFLNIARRRQDKLILDKNISPIEEIKIAFDGYAEDPVTGMLDQVDQESYAVLLDKTSGDENCIFPDYINSINFADFAHTVCLYAWYEVEKEKWLFVDNLSFETDPLLSEKEVSKILQSLKKRYFIKNGDA